MKKSLLLLLGLWALSLPAAHADVAVSGMLIGDTTWSPDNGVYTITGPVTLPADTLLTIEPGTIVEAAHGGTTVLTINGTLSAIGTADQPIAFTSDSDNPASGDWEGIVVGDGGSADIEYVNLSSAGHGGSGFGDFSGIENLGGTLNVLYSSVSQSGSCGILNKAGTLTLGHSTLSSNVVGVCIESGMSTVSDNLFEDNSQFGLMDSSSDSLVLTNNTFSGNGGTASVDATVDFQHTGNTSNDLAGKGYLVSGTARDGLTISSNDLPTITNMITVAAGRTLNVDPGSLIKFKTGAGLVVNGRLQAQGTAAAPIVLTSIKDDGNGGDTNGDGGTTYPFINNGSDNWAGVQFNEGSSGLISYGELHYGGALGPVATDRALLYNLGAQVALDHALIRDSFDKGFYGSAGTTTASRVTVAANQIGAKVAGGNLSIASSSIAGNNLQGLANSGGTVDARNNWWGSADGPKLVFTSTSTSDLIAGSILYDPWLLTEPTDDVSDTGSDSGTFTPPADTTLYGTSTPVVVIPGILGSAEKNGVWVIDPILHTYDNLLDTLRANGYVDGLTLFTLPYDWRESNVVTAGLLKQKIDEAKNICHCAKVNLVAHSMGGLAARYYIESPSYGGDVNQMIFLGTPHKGAVSSYLAWEAGEAVPGFGSFVEKLFLQHQAREQGYSSVYNYIKNFPITSVQELLPITDYIRPNTDTIFKTYPSGYPRNQFLEELEANKNLVLVSGIKVKNYIGDVGANTISGVRTVPTLDDQLWADGCPEDFGNSLTDEGLVLGEGDKTVTTESATFGNDNIVVSAEHQQIPDVAKIQVAEDLLGTTTAQTASRSLISRILIAQVFSPADIEIVAPDGKRVGADPQTGSEVNEIPGAFYSGGSAEEEFVTIPNPQDGGYKVIAKGTGSGAYTVILSNISDSGSVSASETGNIGLGQERDIVFTTQGSAIAKQTTVPVTTAVGQSSVPAPAVGSSHRAIAKPLQKNEASTATPVFKFPSPHVPFRSNILPVVAPKPVDSSAAAYQGAKGLSGMWHKFTGWLRGLFKNKW